MAMPYARRPDTLTRLNFFRARTTPIFRPQTHVYEAPSGSWLLLAVPVGIVLWMCAFYQLGRALF